MDLLKIYIILVLYSIPLSLSLLPEKKLTFLFLRIAIASVSYPSVFLMRITNAFVRPYISTIRGGVYPLLHSQLTVGSRAALSLRSFDSLSIAFASATSASVSIFFHSSEK